MCLSITVSQEISWFIKINLKQNYCSYSPTQKIQNVFLFVLIFEVNIAAEQKQALLEMNFLLFISFHCPQLFYCPPPYPTAALVSLH